MDQEAARRPRSRPLPRLMAMALLAGMVLLGAGCSPRHTPPLMVGTNTWTGYEPLYLARDLGLHEGLPLRLVELGSTTQAMDALRAGQLDLAGLTLDEALTLAREDVPIKIVWVMNISAGADAIVARPGIRSVTDLRGRRVGVEQTAVGAYLLQAALKQAGMQASDVSVVPLPLDEHVAAWRSHQVDAVVTFDPIRQSLVNEGGTAVFDSRAIPGEIVDVLVVREAALQCCDRAIAQLLDGQRKALAHLQSDRSDALARMARRSGVMPADVGAALDGMLLPDAAANRAMFEGKDSGLAQTARKLAQVMHESGLLGGTLDTAPLLEHRFVRGMQP